MPGVMNQIRDEIIEAIDRPALNAIIKGAMVNEVKLWGNTRPRNFVKGMIYATLLKDIQGLGYLKLRKRLVEYSDLSNEAIQHNVKLVRRALGKWAQTVVTADDIRRLGQVASKTQRPPPLSSVVLWIDSTDFCVKGKCSIHRDKSQWSHKLRAPGRRWLTVTNAKGMVQWVAGPYLPTQYDGDLAVLNAVSLDGLFGKCDMVGDNHFRKATEFLQKITLYTNVSKAGRPKKVNGQKVPVTLTKEEEELNETISLVRGKVEAPYGWVKQHFAALSKPFFENKKQHHHLVLYSFAVHRIVLSKQK